MKLIIEIPTEFETDYNDDKFNDFFSRVLCDIKNGTLCGNYEMETAEMFLKAFDESVPMDNIVEKLEEFEKQAGNSIVKNVLVAIIGQMIPEKENVYKE